MDSGSHRIVIQKTRPAFSHEQKVGLYLVISFGVLAILMGTLYIGSHLTQAFDVEYDGPPVLTHEQEQLQAIRELQTTDTDKDGFTDYEELYLYRTSPYLLDTDGDGTDDKTEVTAGADPNCAPGKPCEQTVIEAQGSQGIDFQAPGSEVLDESEAALQALTTGVTPDQVRQFLLDNGTDPELVNSYSDEEIMSIYQSVIVQMDDSGELDQLTEQPAP